MFEWLATSWSLLRVATYAVCILWYTVLRLMYADLPKDVRAGRPPAQADL